MIFINGDFEQKLKLQFAPGIKAGFPSPADLSKPYDKSVYHYTDFIKI